MKLSKLLGLASLGLSLMYAGAALAESYIVIGKGKKVTKKQLAGIERAGGNIRHVMHGVGLVLVDSDAADFQERAGNLKFVHSVPHDISLQWIDPEFSEVFHVEAADPPFTFDDDVLLDLLWGHAAINATDAWEKGHRGAGVRVAVLDSGIDADHTDIAPNLNLFLSTSFVAGEPVDVSVLDPGPSFNHGTHVAGTIGAADNAFGIVGVAPDVELVAVKVLSQFTGSGGLGGILGGMVYAADIDADVVNMSLGASIPRNCTFDGVHFPAWECASIWTAGNRVANYVRQQGTLIIASAGNSGRDLNKDKSLKEWPNDLPGVVPVAATAPIGWLPNFPTGLDNPASYSNFGTSGVKFSAPGGDFVYPGNELCAFFFLAPCWVFDMVFSTVNGDGFYSWSAGTSMAAPHASGVAALIIGAAGGSGSMTPSEVVEAMKVGADDLGKPGNDGHFGHGRVNAANSVP